MSLTLAKAFGKSAPTDALQYIDMVSTTMKRRHEDVYTTPAAPVRKSSDVPVAPADKINRVTITTSVSGNIHGDEEHSRNMSKHGYAVAYAHAYDNASKPGLAAHIRAANYAKTYVSKRKIAAAAEMEEEQTSMIPKRENRIASNSNTSIANAKNNNNPNAPAWLAEALDDAHSKYQKIKGGEIQTTDEFKSYTCRTCSNYVNSPSQVGAFAMAEKQCGRLECGGMKNEDHEYTCRGCGVFVDLDGDETDDDDNSDDDGHKTATFRTPWLKVELCKKCFSENKKPEEKKKTKEKTKEKKQNGNKKQKKAPIDILN